MNVVRLSERPSPARWPEFVPWVTQVLLSRPRERADADALGAQLRTAMRILEEERYRPITRRCDSLEMSGVHLVALLVTAALDAGKRVDLILGALTDDECDTVLDLVGELDEELLVQAGERVPEAATPIAVEPLAAGLAAASPVAMSQEPGRHRFRVRLAGTDGHEAQDAVVEVRLGGGPAGLRQVCGPPLQLAADGVPLPTNDVVDVPVENGADLASWLEVALCRSGDDES